MRDFLFRKRFVALGLALGLCLAGGQALAGGNGVGSGGLQGFQPVNPGSFTPSNAPNLYQCTTAAMTLYVDVDGGSDSNDCTAAGTSACATIQGAVNKVPRCLRHGVTVNVAAGNYAGFYVSGFLCDPSVQTTTGGLFIDAFAAFADAGVATGNATGTATAGSAGSGTTFGTLTDAAATWTASDLVGRFITITGGTGSGQTRVISANTGTVITIVGTWTAPAALSTYVIQDPGVNINTAVSLPATGLSAASANNAAVMVVDNNCGPRTQSIAIRGVRVSNSSGGGVVASDVSNGLVTLSQLRASNTGAVPEFQVGGAAIFGFGTGNGEWSLTDVDVLVPANGYGANVALGSSRLTRVGFHSSAASTVGLFMGTPSSTVLVSGCDFNGVVNPVVLFSGGITSMSGSHITCASSGGTGIQVGIQVPSSFVQPRSANIQLSGALVATCGTGLAASGQQASGDLTGLTGTAATTGLDVRNGAAVTFTSGTTVTGGTQDISIDSGGVTAALADVSAGAPLSGGASGSKVFKR